jgi:hypothetical protein
VNGPRASVRGTAGVLAAGSLISAATLATAFVAGLAGVAWLDDLLSTAGIVALLITPPIGLVVTFFELRPVQPRAALLTLVVLGVLALSTVVALLTR